MSKSLGNVVTLRDVLDEWGREALLLFHLSGAWSKPVDFDDEVLAQAAARADRFRDVFRNHVRLPTGHGSGSRPPRRRRLPRRPQPSPCCEWRDHELFGLRARGLRARVARRRRGRARRGRRLAERQQQARAARDFEEADRLRAGAEASGWEARDEKAASGSCPAGDAGARLRRRPVRELYRGRERPWRPG